MVATPVRFDESLSGWERALYAFLAEGERRSGSRRTSPSDLSSGSRRHLGDLDGQLVGGGVGQAPRPVDVALASVTKPLPSRQIFRISQ